MHVKNNSANRAERVKRPKDTNQLFEPESKQDTEDMHLKNNLGNSAEKVEKPKETNKSANSKDTRMKAADFMRVNFPNNYKLLPTNFNTLTIWDFVRPDLKIKLGRQNEAREVFVDKEDTEINFCSPTVHQKRKLMETCPQANFGSPINDDNYGVVEDIVQKGEKPKNAMNEKSNEQDDYWKHSPNSSTKPF